MIEQLAAAVHQAYLETCERLGWEVKPANRVPYEQLSEEAKELDRASVRAVLKAVESRCESLEADSKRLDWMESGGFFGKIGTVITGWSQKYGDYKGWVCKHSEEDWEPCASIREAIDKAMEAK